MMKNGYTNQQYTKECKKEKQLSCSLSSIIPAFQLDDNWFFELVSSSSVLSSRSLSHTLELRSRFQLSPHRAPSFFFLMPSFFCATCPTNTEGCLWVKFVSEVCEWRLQVHLGTWAVLENSYNHEYWRSGDIFQSQHVLRLLVCVSFLSHLPSSLISLNLYTLHFTSYAQWKRHLSPGSQPTPSPLSLVSSAPSSISCCCLFTMPNFPLHQLLPLKSSPQILPYLCPFILSFLGGNICTQYPHSVSPIHTST